MASSQSVHWIRLFVWVGWWVIVGIMFYGGAESISEGSKYAESATKEKCLVIDVETTECVYGCRDDNDESTWCGGNMYKQGDPLGSRTN